MNHNMFRGFYLPSLHRVSLCAVWEKRCVRGHEKSQCLDLKPWNENELQRKMPFIINPNFHKIFSHKIFKAEEFCNLQIKFLKSCSNPKEILYSVFQRIGNTQKISNKVTFAHRRNQSYFFKSGQKMALRAPYVVICPQELSTFMK